MTPKSSLFGRHFTLRASAFALAGMTAGLSAGACSLVLDFDECKVDADCEFGSGSYRCDAGKCVSDDDVGDESDTSTDSDTDTGPDTETDETATETETGTEECTTHTECVEAHTETWICGAGGTCMNALSTECQIFEWPNDTPSDNVVIVGSIMPTSPPFDSLVLPLQNATQLAVEDFNKEASLGNGQKLAWIGCDSKGSADLAQASAEHLVAAGVPAIVGPIFSEDVLQVAEAVAIPNDVFVMTPTGSNKEITALADNDLVWRTISSDIYQANALADRLATIAPETNMVILHKNDAYGNDLAIDTFASLPGSLADVTSVYPYNVPLTTEELLNEIGTVLGTVLTVDQPDTVVIMGTSEAQAIILVYLQTVASLPDPKPPIPRFVVSHGAVPAMQYAIEAAPDVPTKTFLYTIMEGVAPIIFDAENFAAFNIRYKIKFNEQDAITTASLSYDSLLVIALAMSAIPADQPITGSNIAAQMPKLVDKAGTAVSFSGTGTTFIKTAVNALSIGGTVDLKGVSGELDFDLETGEVRTNLIGWETAAIGGDVTKPTLAPQRMYVLDPAPAETGTWMDLP